jgi:predicted Zn-dependent protease
MQGRADEAISYLRRLIAEQPDHPYPQRALGDVLYQTGRVIESIPHLQKTIELEPQNPKHRLSLAMSYVTSSNQPAAFAVLQAGLKVMPNDALLHFNLGYLFMVKDDLISARTHLRRTIAIDPKFPDADWMLERVEAATATTGEK